MDFGADQSEDLEDEDLIRKDEEDLGVQSLESDDSFKISNSPNPFAEFCGFHSADLSSVDDDLLTPSGKSSKPRKPLRKEHIQSYRQADKETEGAKSITKCKYLTYIQKN